MTVLITGLEMPPRCGEGCPFYDVDPNDGYPSCRATKYTGKPDFEAFHKVGVVFPEGCPLIEVLTPRTNGDKLRTMTDEEIIKFECSITACIYEADPDKQRSECHDFDCERCWREWLKEEVE